MEVKMTSVLKEWNPENNPKSEDRVVPLVWRNEKGQIHRLDGPTRKTEHDEWWHKNGKSHRIGGPSISIPTGKHYYVEGKRHRIDGPASDYLDGRKYWYINGVKYEPEEHPYNVFRSEHNISEDINDWPKDKRMLFKLIYGV